MMDERNTLVVPIRLEALAVNSRFKGKPVRRWRMDYDRLLQQKNPEPLPFSTEIETNCFDEPRHWGIYLHWVVPEALRKGGQDDSDQADFPPLPNRWLVARRHGKSDSGTDHRFRFWMIESDKLDPGNKGGSTFACVYPDGNIQVTRLGVSCPLEEYAGDIVRNESATFRDIKPESAQAAPGGPQPVLPRSLNALGFAEVNFLAYQPLVNDVFSFHDDLSDIREGEALKREGLLSYCVAGWYSDAGDDILDRAKAVGIEKLLADLAWTIEDPASDARKDPLGPDIQSSLKRTVFYGRQYRVDWQQAVPAADEIKAEDLHVAFGNNALDAMLALLEKTEYGGPVEWGTLQLLKPFVYGQLPLVREPGGFVRLNQEMRKTWFKAKPGGRCWVLEPRNPAGSTDPEANAEVGDLLGQINDRQEALEQTRMELEGLQKLLYDTWWQLNAKKNGPGPEPVDRNTIEHQIQALKTGALAQQIKQKQIDAGSIELDIEKKFKELFKILAGSEADSGAVPDNVLEVQKILQDTHGLIETAKPAFWKPHDPTILIAGLDHKASAEEAETLACRLPSGLQSRDALALPGKIHNSILIALLKDFAARQDQDDLQWEQPWDPFFLEWEAEWSGLPFSSGKQRLWDYTAFDYESQAAPAQDGEKQPAGRQVLRGRTFLTPQNNQLLRYQLQNFKAVVSAEVTDTPPDPGVKPKPASGPTAQPLKQFAEFVDQIARRRLLSQSLLDFNSQLQMRGTQLSIIPKDGQLAELIGEQYQDQPLASPPGPIEGRGMRQGHFKISRLEVYDGFGQCLLLVGPGGLIDAEMLAPIRDSNLTPIAKAADSSRLIELKPRILEYTRLRFDFLPAREPGPENDSSHTPVCDDNPVAGWFLYNHLDRSLVLFDGKGKYLGELRVVRGKVTAIKLDENVDPVLRKVISRMPDNAQVFNLFLNVIDETLWTIEPNASLQSQHLAVWLGRPLALVRARLKFESYGSRLLAGPLASAGRPELAPSIPLSDGLNPVLRKQRQQQFRNFNFEVRLGSRGIRQDGLIGYYHENVFHTVHDLKAIPALYFKHIQPIREGNFLDVKFSEPLDLTLLIDPQAAVYAQTGILPYTSLQLPPRFVDRALENIQVSFRYHCLLTGHPKVADPAEAKSVSMPLPALRRGNWEWIEYPETKFEFRAVSDAGKMPREPARLRDGRLVLRDPFVEGGKK